MARFENNPGKEKAASVKGDFSKWIAGGAAAGTAVTGSAAIRGELRDRKLGKPGVHKNGKMTQARRERILKTALGGFLGGSLGAIAAAKTATDAQQRRMNAVIDSVRRTDKMLNDSNLLMKVAAAQHRIAEALLGGTLGAGTGLGMAALTKPKHVKGRDEQEERAEQRSRMRKAAMIGAAGGVGAAGLGSLLAREHFTGKVSKSLLDEAKKARDATASALNADFAKKDAEYAEHFKNLQEFHKYPSDSLKDLDTFVSEAERNARVLAEASKKELEKVKKYKVLTERIPDIDAKSAAELNNNVYDQLRDLGEELNNTHQAIRAEVHKIRKPLNDLFEEAYLAVKKDPTRELFGVPRPERLKDMSDADYDAALRRYAREKVIELAEFHIKTPLRPGDKLFGAVLTKKNVEKFDTIADIYKKSAVLDLPHDHPLAERLKVQKEVVDQLLEARKATGNAFSAEEKAKSRNEKLKLLKELREKIVPASQAKYDAFWEAKKLPSDGALSAESKKKAMAQTDDRIFGYF